MARSWKDLEVLRFGSTEYTIQQDSSNQENAPENLNDRKPTLTLAAVDFLCTHCPRLHSLALFVNAESVPTVSALTQNCLLQTLEFGTSWIKILPTSPYGSAIPVDQKVSVTRGELGVREVIDGRNLIQRGSERSAHQQKTKCEFTTLGEKVREVQPNRGL
jgi:hypothetical protein